MSQMESLCPRCRQQVQSKGNPYGPFCSKRCKLIDLESWMSQRFGVPIEENLPKSPDSFGDLDASSSNGK